MIPLDENLMDRTTAWSRPWGSSQGRSTGKGSLGAFPKASLVLCLLVALTSLAPAAMAADSFYVNRLRDGKAAYDRADYQEAVENLRLACFGFLDDLDLYAEGLVRLALAQEAAGDLEAFRTTFRRILEIEERFEAYSRNPPETGLKAAFEDRLLEHQPESLLASAPAFEGLAQRKAAQRLETLPAAQRLTALQELAERHPEETLWKLRLAGLHLERGAPAEALPLLDAVVAARPEDAEAHCLRGRALMDRPPLEQSCAGALPELAYCPGRTGDPDLALGVARCLQATGDLEGASAFLASLEGEARTDRGLRRLSKQVERDLKELRKEQEDRLAADGGTAPLPEDADSGTSGESPPPERPAAPKAAEAVTGAAPAPAPSGPRTPEQERKMEQARALLSQARRAADLEPAGELAEEVADARPDDQEAQYLAAEIAYRGSRWQEAARYFEQGGDPGPSRPNLLFFKAVSLYETGDLEGARAALRSCLPQLQRTSFVQRYAKEILGEE